jgi:hypothetical protein
MGILPPLLPSTTPEGRITEATPKTTHNHPQPPTNHVGGCGWLWAAGTGAVAENCGRIAGLSALFRNSPQTGAEEWKAPFGLLRKGFGVVVARKGEFFRLFRKTGNQPESRRPATGARKLKP